MSDLRAFTDTHLADAKPLERRDGMYLRVVELRVSVGPWAAGTRGTIVDAFMDDAMVEIADDEGRTLDLLTLPYGSLSVL